MTKQEFLNRMDVLTEKAYDFNCLAKNQRIAIESMTGLTQYPKVVIYYFDDENKPKSCETLYDQFDSEKINEMFNI